LFESKGVIMVMLDVVVRMALIFATATLFVIVLSAYSRLRSRKMLLITIGFGILFLHALLSVPELFEGTYDMYISESLHLFVDFIGLIFILFGTLKD
jgi:hypothetical protein